MSNLNSDSLDQLLRVLFYKIYCTPRRYNSNVGFIFSLKDMLGIGDDKFRVLCENLDEDSLKESLPEIMRNSLDTIEKEIELRSQNNEFISSDSEIKNSSEEVLELAFYYLDKGNIDEAIIYFEKSVNSSENNWENYLYLSDSYMISSNLNMAKKVVVDALYRMEGENRYREVFQRRLNALNLESGDEYYKRDIFCEYYLKVAMKLFEEEKYDESANYYMHVLRIMPGDYEAMIKLGCCFWRMGDKISAVRFFHQSLIIMEMPVLVSNM